MITIESAKWYFDPTLGEVYKNWTRSTDITNDTINRNIAHKRINCLDKIHLSNRIYRDKV